MALAYVATKSELAQMSLPGAPGSFSEPVRIAVLDTECDDNAHVFPPPGQWSLSQRLEELSPWV